MLLSAVGLRFGDDTVAILVRADEEPKDVNAPPFPAGAWLRFFSG